MEDVLIDARRIVDATQMPLLVDIDTGWGGAFNIARAIRNFTNVGVAAVHMQPLPPIESAMIGRRASIDNHASCNDSSWTQPWRGRSDCTR